jgi:exonuclease SbcD
VGRAHALAEFNTLNVPHVKVLDKPCFYSADELKDLSSSHKNLDLQVIALPWMSRSEISALLDLPTRDPNFLYQAYFQHLKTTLDSWLNQIDPEKPTLLTAHASVEGAVYGGERSVSLGSDPVLPLELLTDPRIDYVALGHIHKPQDLNQDQHPPVIYPGSIERVDFGEANDEKYYILADLEPGQTNIEWKPLQNIRKFLDLHLELKSRDRINEQIMDAMPDQPDIEDAIVRLVLEYPRSWESLINEQPLLEHTEPAFEFHLVKQPLMEDRLRLPRDQVIGSLSPEDLLNHYWELTNTPQAEREELNQLASELFDTDAEN